MDILSGSKCGYIERKSLLNKSKVEYTDYCINHVEGCAHACTYCYAFKMWRRYRKGRTYEQWKNPRIVSNAMDLLIKEIPKRKHKVKWVHLCFMTDPFMYGYSEICDLSIRIIQLINNSGIYCTTLTKGVYPKNLCEITGLNNLNEYGITVVSLDENFRKQYEPNSAPVEQRLSSLKHLHDSGYKTWVSIEPYPTPNILQQDIGELLHTVSFVDKIIFGKMNYVRQATQFKGRKEFNNDMTKTVVAFCESKGIAYHIKKGTQTCAIKSGVE